MTKRRIPRPSNFTVYKGTAEEAATALVFTALYITHLTMALSADDKKHIKNFWPSAAAQCDKLGGEALFRMFNACPQTKTYFPKFDCSKDSAHVRAHGKKVFDALTEAANHLDNIPGCLSKLSDLHAYDLRVDPGNFTLLTHHLLVVFAIHFPDKFDTLTHQALDKFLVAVSGVLTSKYR